MKVEDIMNEVSTIEKDLKLLEVAKIFSAEDISSVVLVQRKRVKGIITERDIIKNIEHLSKKISLVMTKDVATIGSKKDLDDAAEIMRENKVKRLLVVDDDELVGIITATDLIANADMINGSFSFI
jgi:CBS domain-containing protein